MKKILFILASLCSLALGGSFAYKTPGKVLTVIHNKLVPTTTQQPYEVPVSHANTKGQTYPLRTYQEGTYTAYVLSVNDPRKIEVVETKYVGDVGQTVSEFVQSYHASAGINGGSFEDTGWRGTGAHPYGLVIQNGKLMNRGDLGVQPIIGFNASGKLIAGSYSYSDLRNMNVVQALSFGPVLVRNGQDVVQGDGGWGAAPRTVIGQKDDGTVLLVVTDGRELNGPNNVGATLQQMAQLMIRFGATTAANLDGGSSATLINGGQLVNTPTDVLGERNIATAVLVK